MTNTKVNHACDNRETQNTRLLVFIARATRETQDTQIPVLTYGRRVGIY